MNRQRCNCGGRLIWNNDFMEDEIYENGNSNTIVSIYSCTDCGAMYEMFINEDKVWTRQISKEIEKCPICGEELEHIETFTQDDLYHNGNFSDLVEIHHCIKCERDFEIEI